jgi:hypothetical protein
MTYEVPHTGYFLQKKCNLPLDKYGKNVFLTLVEREKSVLIERPTHISNGHVHIHTT